MKNNWSGNIDKETQNPQRHQKEYLKMKSTNDGMATVLDGFTGNFIGLKTDSINLKMGTYQMWWVEREICSKWLVGYH